MSQLVSVYVVAEPGLAAPLANHLGDSVVREAPLMAQPQPIQPGLRVLFPLPDVPIECARRLVTYRHEPYAVSLAGDDEHPTVEVEVALRAPLLIEVMQPQTGDFGPAGAGIDKHPDDRRVAPALKRLVALTNGEERFKLFLAEHVRRFLAKARGPHARHR